MPTPQEFSTIVDANTILFIGLVIRLFLGLVMCLAFAFGFIIAVLYCSGKLLIASYAFMRLVADRVNHREVRL